MKPSGANDVIRFVTSAVAPSISFELPLGIVEVRMTPWSLAVSLTMTTSGWKPAPMSLAPVPLPV